MDLTPRDPFVLKVRAVEDEAPKIVARRESLEQVVLDSEVVTFDLVASDDFGVKRVGLEWIGCPHQGGWKNADHRRESGRGRREPEKKELAVARDVLRDARGRGAADARGARVERRLSARASSARVRRRSSCTCSTRPITRCG